MSIAGSRYHETLAGSRPAGKAPGVATRLVLDRFARWSGGPLEIRLPDGSSLSAGRRDGNAAPLVLLVHDWRFFQRVLLAGDIGAGESFMDGDWDASDLVAFARGYLESPGLIDHGSPLLLATRAANLVRRLLDANTRSGSRRNIRAHYDLSNEMFQAFLDESMTYSSAVFEKPGMSLAEAQLAKADGACRALGLVAGQHLLEIGSGWGTLAIHAAREYGCRVTSITLSQEQLRLATARAREAGLGDRIDFRLADYREIDGTFDHIVSIEMLEAVGAEYHGEFFARCDRMLAPGGRMFLQSIVVPDSRFESYRDSFDWIRKYIYPGGCLASHGSIARALAERTSMRVEWMRDIGPHYEPTLRHWRERFLARRADVRALGFDERFVRMWEFYLASCEAAFATGHVGNLQLLLGRAHEAARVGG